MVRSSDSDQLISDDSQRDYRNENNCDRMTFVHYGVHDDEGRNPVNFKERGDACGPERGALIGVEYLDATRKWCCRTTSTSPRIGLTFSSR